MNTCIVGSCVFRAVVVCVSQVEGSQVKPACHHGSPDQS